jgi:HAD superfamily hydrolase (TIGR01549 family)
MTASQRQPGLPKRELRAPKALLLDFGGVVVATARRPDWEWELARAVDEMLTPLASARPPLEQVVRDIVAGCTADGHWKNAKSRPFAPRELRQEEFWGDFVAADWPEPARRIVVDAAADLCRRMGHARSHREVRDGILDLLDLADASRVPVGIVSNALSGQVHLDFLEERGLASRFAVIVHSDEAGIRKPNPEMIHIAVRALGLSPADAWYVGDNFDRDVLCGRRAGIGGNILMEAGGTYDLPYDLALEPDAIVADPVELTRLFERAREGVAA